MAQTTTGENSYKTIALVLGIALIVAVIGWISAAGGSADVASLSDRLETCNGLTLASENPECEDAIDELEGILVEFQGTLQNIAVPADGTPATATSTSGTTTPTSTVPAL